MHVKYANAYIHVHPCVMQPDMLVSISFIIHHAPSPVQYMQKKQGKNFIQTYFYVFASIKNMYFLIKGTVTVVGSRF